MSPRVIIVGGGFAGLSAARALRRTSAQLILVDKQNHHLFQPLLYQVATAALSPGNIASPIRKIVARQRNCDVVMAEVTGVDLASSTVRLVDREYRYDYLILAAGVRPHYFGRADWARHAPGLKTIDDATDVRARFLLAFEQAELETDVEARRAALTFVVVGGGPTGVEMAGALAEIARHTLRKDFRHIDTQTTRVVLIDAEDRVLPTFDSSLSARAARDLDALGVELILRTRVIDVNGQGVEFECDGRRTRIGTRNVIWAAGVRAVDLGPALGVETDHAGRVRVGDDLAIPGHPEVFVVGDLAHRISPTTGEPEPGVAQCAIQMGRFAGEIVAREIGAQGRDRGGPPRGVFAYSDRGSMATIGRNRAVAEIRGLRFGGLPAFVTWALVHILFLIDFRNKVTTLAEWAWMYFFYERGVRLITGEGRRPGPTGPPHDPRSGRDRPARSDSDNNDSHTNDAVP